MRLARILDVQAVAEVTVPLKDDRSDVLLTILAPGSGEPDVIRVKLDDPVSVNRALRRLDATPAVARPSIGLQAADILDTPGAVVVAVDPDGVAQKAGVVPGDTIVRLNNQAIGDVAALSAALANAKVGESVAIELKDRAGAAKKAETKVESVPQIIAMVDQTLLFNTLVLDYRRTLAAPNGPADAGFVRLNLGVALMRLGNWAEARAELEQVKLADAPGVGDGTVQYLLGLCREGLGQPLEAEAAWRRAIAAKGALLTADGPAVRELAERKLAESTRRDLR